MTGAVYIEAMETDVPDLTAYHRMQEKLKALNFDLTDNGTAPAVIDDPVSPNEATVLPLDSVPSDFTDQDHFERNKHLPAVPTREQFLRGMVRGFRLHLDAEDWEPAYTERDEIVYPKRERRKKVAERLQNGVKTATLTRFLPKKGLNRGYLGGKSHELELFLTQFAMFIRGNFALRTGFFLSIIVAIDAAATVLGGR